MLVELFPDWLGSTHALLFFGSLTIGFLASLLAFLGSVRVLTAVIGAAFIATVASLLLLWMGLRFEDPEKLGNNAGFLSFFVLITVSWPFFIARYGKEGRWLDYERLFEEAWALFVRGAAALAFLGVFWMTLSGLVFGLALAVLLEMTSVIGTLRGLAINLLCLLLPPIALVMLVFAIMVPVRGRRNRCRAVGWLRRRGA